ncbi:hypothetical protein GIB67_011786 [Kingdonia uniflora]|uniref:Kinesin-like protein n=1 Tax=Kingdonia uniflora TaxID=39325 RepID=A0A7J7NXK3_9MAGN|nr:hypothetical protein GIB67_011786 [Kingdonia uniflora]
MGTPSTLKTPTNASRCPSSLKSLDSNMVSKVKVVVRVRPFLPEGPRNLTPCVSVLSPEYPLTNEVVVHLKDQETSRNKCYKLDSFFNQDDSVSEIFEDEVCPLISRMFRGYNATVFAYGATGSGKTHTMQGTNELPGLMALAMSVIFSMCQSSGSSTEISYYEMYMDKCYDLLDCKEKEISVFDDKDGKVQLKGLSRVPVSSMSEFCEVLSCGIHKRKVAHTGLNDVSSRSHGVLVIVVSTPSNDGSGLVVTGKLNLIDLAGNEDNRRTCNKGIRLQESAKINQSLFALSNVIYALNNNKARVPYRESKLTRILQDSLGGTSRSLMVACLNPREYQESVHTVSLAARSQNISNYVSSGWKEDTSLMKIDMEEKLRAWFESKGKTKSVKKSLGLTSPFLSKTPIVMSSLKKPKSCKTSSKAKALIDQGLSHASKRNLFSSGAAVATSVEDICPDIVKDCKERIIDMQDDVTIISEEESCKDRPLQPCEEDQLIPYSCKDPTVYSDQSCEEDDHLNSCILSGTNGGEEPKEHTITIGTTSMAESMTSLCVKSLATENMANTPFTNYLKSPPLSKIRALQQSLRKVLSPINSNVNMKPLDDLSSKDQVCFVFFEPKTPKTPYVWTCDTDELQATDTPLDKFNAQSSSLKCSLAQEYLEFLNSASKEELLSFKVSDPVDSSRVYILYDLEKVGISFKQVNDMFRKTARGIFE